MKKLNKDHIRNNPLWLSRNQELNWNIPTNSWFNVRSLKKYNRNNTTRTINNNKLRAKMVIIKPTPKQKKILFHWLEIYRQVYNATVKYIKNNSITSFQNITKHYNDNKAIPEGCTMLMRPYNHNEFGEKMQFRSEERNLGSRR